MTTTQIISTIVNALKQSGVPDVNARVIASQAALETGNFTSNVFLKDNNCFGMKIPSVRKSPYIISGGSAAPSSEGSTPYAKYASIADSAKDMANWLNYNGVIWSMVKTPESYAAWLKSKGFYGSGQEQYANGIIGYYNRIAAMVINNPAKSAIVLAVAAGLLGLGIYLFIKRKTL